MSISAREELLFNTGRDNIDRTIKRYLQDSSAIKYDAYAIPPNIDLAAIHAWSQESAETVKFDELLTKEEEERTVCPCCRLTLSKRLYSINCSVDELSELGTGVALYFVETKFIIVALSVLFAISGLHDEIRIDSYCKENNISNDGNCVQFLNLYFSPKISSEENGTQLYLNCVSVLLIVILFIVGRVYMKYKMENFEENSVKISDYSVLLTNLDEEVTEIEIEEHLSAMMGRKIEVAKVNYCYRLREYLESVKARVKLHREKEMLAHRETHIHTNVDKFLLINELNLFFQKYSDRIQQLEKRAVEMARLSTTLQKTLTLGETEEIRTNEVLVTLERKSDCKEVYNKFKVSNLRRILEECKGKLLEESGGELLRGRRVIAERAPEPLDIRWENLETTFLERYKNRFISLLIALLVLAISYIFLLGVTLYQAKEIDGDSNTDSISYQLFGLLCSIIIVVINEISCLIMTYLSERERPKSHTSFHSHLVIKLTIMQFINTALIPTVLYVYSIASFTEKFMVRNVFYIFISNAFLYNLVMIFPPPYIIKWIKKRFLRKNNEWRLYTQKEANLIFEKPPFFIEDKFAYINKTFLMSMFFAPIYPIGLAINIAGLILFYWISKIILVRRSTFPNSLSKEIVNRMMVMCMFGPLLYSISSILFETVQRSDTTLATNAFYIFNITISVIAILFCSEISKLSLLRNYFERMFHIELEKELLFEYTDLPIEYEDVNPITAKLEKLNRIFEDYKQTKHMRAEQVNKFAQNMAEYGLETELERIEYKQESTHIQTTPEDIERAPPDDSLEISIIQRIVRDMQ